MNLPKTLTCPLFDSFWKSYPLKVGKIQAQKAWKKLAPDEKDTELILTAIERQKKEPLWSQGMGIPHPSTYINQARFMDEPIAERKQAANAGWQRTDAGICAKGREIGLDATRGETMPQYLARILAKLNQGE